jgi:hypothetical protein
MLSILQLARMLSARIVPQINSQMPGIQRSHSAVPDAGTRSQWKYARRNFENDFSDGRRHVLQRRRGINK